MPYDVGDDPYRDPSTGILRNILDLRTQRELDRAEAEITAVEISALTIESSTPPEEHNADFLLAVHKAIFGDIYDWAGGLRTIELSKDDTSFARAEHLPVSMAEIFASLQSEGYLDDLGTDTFIARIAHYYSELNVLHPFREGNGRTIRTFLASLADSLGWHIAWDEMNAEQNIRASIAAYNGNEQPMREMLSAIISPIDIFWGRDPYEVIDNLG